MAWAVDQATLGPHSDTAGFGGTPVGLTTNVAVASGAWVFVVIGSLFTSTVTAISGGGLTWTRVNVASAGSLKVCFARAYAPAGLASGTVISYTMSAADHDHRIMAAGSFSGGDASSFDTANAGTTGAASPWSTGSVTSATADELIVGGVVSEGTALTATSGTKDASNTDPSPDHTAIIIHRIEAVAGSYSMTGTSNFGATIEWGGIAFAMSPAAGVAAGIATTNIAAQVRKASRYAK